MANAKMAKITRLLAVQWHLLGIFFSRCYIVFLRFSNSILSRLNSLCYGSFQDSCQCLHGAAWLTLDILVGDELTLARQISRFSDITVISISVLQRELPRKRRLQLHKWAISCIMRAQLLLQDV